MPKAYIVDIKATKVYRKVFKSQEEADAFMAKASLNKITGDDLRDGFGLYKNLIDIKQKPIRIDYVNIIVRKDSKNNSIVIFYLDIECNKGNIWCAELGQSGQECSIDYYNSTKPATEEEIARAVNWIEEHNFNPVVIHKRLGKAFKRKIWNLK